MDEGDNVVELRAFLRSKLPASAEDFRLALGDIVESLRGVPLDSPLGKLATVLEAANRTYDVETGREP